MRSPSKSAVRRRAAALIILAGTAVMLVGCREYTDGRDTISLEAGDAIQVNHATQVIERWPRAAGRGRWLSDGERARVAAQNYRTRKTPAPKTDPGASDREDATVGGGS